MRLLWTALAILVVASGVSHAQSRNGMVDGKTLDQWIKLLKSRDPSVVERAIQNITKFGPAARSDAGPELIKWVNDPRDVAVRSNAAFAIGVIGLDSGDVRAGVTALVRCLNNDNQRVVRFRAIYALGKLGPDAESATPALVSAMRDSAAWEVRASAADALAKVTYRQGKPPMLRAVTALTHALSDRAAQVRLQAILALATVGAPGLVGEARAIRADETQALRTLVRKDKDKGNAVWGRAALLGLKLEQNPADVTKLVGEIGKEMTNPELEVRVQTAAALGALVKTDRAAVRGLLPGLVGMLADKEQTAAQAASDTLVHVKDLLSDRDVDRIDQLLHSSRASARAAAAQTLGLLGDKSIRYIGDLVALLQDPESSVASAACDALANIGEPAKALALPALNQIVISGPYDVRPSALRALIRLSQPKAEQQNVPNKATR